VGEADDLEEAAVAREVVAVVAEGLEAEAEDLEEAAVAREVVAVGLEA
jgi:hypothetical protein